MFTCRSPCLPGSVKIILSLSLSLLPLWLSPASVQVRILNRLSLVVCRSVCVVCQPTECMRMQTLPQRLESGDDVLLLLCDPDDSLFEASTSDTNTFSDQNPFDKSFKEAINKHSIKKANSLAHAQAHCSCICQFNQPPLVQ
jgi:hypothetical protein